MSIQVVTKITGTGVPRFSESQLETIENENEFSIEKDFFCSQEHSFTVTFSEGFTDVILPIWECPECETVALDFPPDTYDSM